MSDYYNHSTYPSQGAIPSSSAMRAELELIEAGFAKLPVLTGNNSKLVQVNAAGNALEATTILGTGIATALAVAVGTDGAPVINGGALGTPSSGSAANLTSFPTLNQNTSGTAAGLSGTPNISVGTLSASGDITAGAGAKVVITSSDLKIASEGYGVLSANATRVIAVSNTGAAVTGTLSATGTAIDFVTSGTVLTVGTGANNGTVSAGVFTDRTKAYTGDALAEIAAITHVDGEIDHATLPAFAQVELVKPIFEAQEVLKPIYEAHETLVTKEVDGTPVQVIETSQVQAGEETVIEKVKVGEQTVVERDLGAMISMLTVAVQQLTTRLAAVEAKQG